MSKALVIKGANFAANKIETITISEPIPCTSISISPSSVTFTEIGTAQQITTTVMPSDTTDAVYYMSSNEDVAVVSPTGLITCVGVGTATITAMCGEQSAVCTVTSTIIIDANSELTGTNGYNHTGTNLADNKDYVSVNTSAKSRVYLSPTETPSGYHAISGGSSEPWLSLYPILIPKGTQKIEITTPSGLGNHINVTLLNSTEKPTYNITNKGVRAVAPLGDTKTSSTKGEIELDQYSGYDSFVFTCQTSGSDASAVTGDVTITFT